MARDEVRRHFRGDNYALASELGGGADASATVKGITKLSVVPVVAANPIAVGDNDSRMSNARTPNAHAASHVNGTDDIQLASSTVKGLMSTAYASKLDGIQAGATDDSALVAHAAAADPHPGYVLETDYEDADLLAKITSGTLNAPLNLGTTGSGSGVALNIRGNRTLGIDFTAGAYSSGVMLLPNFGTIRARDGTNTLAHNILHYSNTNSVVIGTDASSISLMKATTVSGGTLSCSPTLSTAAIVFQPTLLVSSANQQVLALNTTVRPTVAGVGSVFGIQAASTVVDDGGVSNALTGPLSAIWSRIALAATYSGTVAESRVLTIGNATLNSGSGVITTQKGIHIENMTSGLTNWGLYVTGPTQSYFGGPVVMENSNGNFVLGTGAGTKIGTTPTQKLAFWNATPIVQPAGTTDLKDVLETTGLMASGGAAPLNLDGGALTSAGLTVQESSTDRLKLFNTGKIQYDSDNSFASMANDIMLITKRHLTPRTGTDNAFRTFVTSQGAGAVGDGHVGIVSQIGDRTAVANRAITNIVSGTGGVMRVSATGHGWSTGERVHIYGITGTGNVSSLNNNMYYITFVDANTFELQGTAFGGTYTSGGTASNRGLWYGMSVSVNPLVDRGGLLGASLYGDDVAGLVIQNASTNSSQGTDAIYISNNASFTGSEWGTLFTGDCDSDWGIRLNGAITNYALDFYGGSTTLGAIRLKNNQAVVARNAADGADLEIIKLNTSNEFQLAQPTRFLGNLNVTDAVNVVFGTTTGTKIGTATSQKLALWNATPIIQPAGWTTPSNYTSRKTFDRTNVTLGQLADYVATLEATVFKLIGMLGV